jgi:septum formation protein
LNTIILASGSPRRKNLLRKIGFTFEIHSSKVSEDYKVQWSPTKIAETLAVRKAKSVAQNYGNALIIGADTIVAFHDKILEKPTSHSEATTMLQQLSGKSHQVLTGVSLIKTDASNNIIENTTFVENTTVTFGNLNSTLIDAYIETEKPMDKAGAYGIQDPHGALFVKAINGDYYNVMGFPLHSFYNIMASFAPELLSEQKLYQ